jgi:DNA helicase II / ATP-dependent DNA helicase PcrA
MAASVDPIHALSGFKPPAAAAGHWHEFEATIGMLRRNAAGWPAELDLVCRWYGPHLERIHEDAALREADLLQLTQIASTYPSRERFLTELTLDPPDATSDEAGVPILDEDYLILSTIHSAKGQEWASVFLLNTVDGCLPSDLATGSTPEIEEERRLLYVAMTRARDQLHLMVPQRFFTYGQRGNGDRHVYAQRTRFIPNSMLDHFESSSWPPPKPASNADKQMRERVDVRAKMRRMWG